MSSRAFEGAGIDRRLIDHSVDQYDADLEDRIAKRTAPAEYRSAKAERSSPISVRTLGSDPAILD
jgi:hypothetical protein